MGMQPQVPTRGQPAIECGGVSIVKGGAAVVAGLDWRVEADERWVVIGPNGAGKSSLIDVISARAHPSSGQVRLLGQQLGAVDVFELRPRIGLVATGVERAIGGAEPVRDAVLTAAYGMSRRWREAYGAPDLQRADDLLQRFGVAALAERPFGTLSDGERKRVLVARALMPDPELLVLDEPAAGLDLGARESLVAMLASLAADPAAPAIVMVTHHVEEVPPGFTHAMLLSAGSVVAAGPVAEVIRGSSLSATFGIPITVGRFAGRYFAVAGGTSART